MLTSAIFLAASALLGVHEDRVRPLADSPSALGSADEEIRSLAINLDNAIKLCSAEIVRASTGEKVISKAENAALDKGMLTWMVDPPKQLVEMARDRPARFGRWADPHASIFVIAHETSPTCRILVGESPWTAAVRPVLYAKIQDDNFWKSDGPEQPFAAESVRATFHANVSKEAKVQPMISIVAPTSSKEGGIQLSIGVHLVAEGEK
ncbi:MAG: hypothetical protein P0Y64_07155 [Candidatus Sphingomonas colombiensis]|nr:hypothetical protein [Sphingomonas sp.]WEK44557.1 MAG: hypothetical protein P0Y64_07155 [Sphingomonas sp.]